MSALETVQSVGPARTRRRLEWLVNQGLITLEEADCLYYRAFGTRLKAVKAPRPAPLPWVGMVVVAFVTAAVTMFLGLVIRGQ